ncbi:MAG TPA: glycosyltransferase family 39 protein, partial [Streptosporangiaceae bacterium]
MSEQQTRLKPSLRPASQQAGRDARTSRIARLACCGGPALVAFLLGLWQISARSFTQDEAATLSATRRPLPGLLRMLGHIDAVHGAYYLLIHCVVLAFGTSETAVRFPSVVATAVAAGVLAALGRRLAGLRAGAAAGLLFAVAPPVTGAAQNARPFALATALAVTACYLFTRYAQTGLRRHAIGYAAALAATGCVEVLALMVVLAHAVTLLLAPDLRPRRRGFLAAATAALIVVSPLIWLDVTQVQQVAWEQRPGPVVLLSVLALVAASGAVARVALRAGKEPTPGPAWPEPEPGPTPAGPAWPGPES